MAGWPARGGDQRPNRGSTSHDSASKMQPADCSRYLGPYSVQVTVPSNLGKRMEPEVTNATETVEKPSRTLHVGSPVATSEVQSRRERDVDKDKKASSHLRGEANTFIPNLMPIADSSDPVMIAGLKARRFFMVTWIQRRLIPIVSLHQFQQPYKPHRMSSNMALDRPMAPRRHRKITSSEQHLFTKWRSHQNVGVWSPDHDLGMQDCPAAAETACSKGC